MTTTNDIDSTPSEDYELYDPCTNCGEEEDFYQKIEQWEQIQVEDGDLDYVGSADQINLLQFRCASCDQLLYKLGNDE